MSTIKISELATSAISLTDFLAKADSTGLASKNTIQNLANVTQTIGDVSFKGSVFASDTTVTLDGWYLAADNGTYTNNGGFSIDLSDNVVIIIVSQTQTIFEELIIPISITIDAIPTLQSTNAVESGGVATEISKFKTAFLKNTALNKIIKEIYIDGVISEDIYIRTFKEISTGVYQFRIATHNNGTVATILNETNIPVNSKYIQLADASNNLVVHLIIDWDNISNLPVIDSASYEDNLLISNYNLIDNSPSIKDFQSKYNNALLIGANRFQYGYYRTTDVGFSGGISSSTSHRSLSYNVQEGDSHIISSSGGSSARLYCYLDSSNNILEQALDSVVSTDNPLLVNAPRGAVKLLINALSWYNNFENGNIYASKITGNIPVLDRQGFFENNLLNNIIREVYVNTDENITDKLYLREFKVNSSDSSKYDIRIAKWDGSSLSTLVYNESIPTTSNYVQISNSTNNTVIHLHINWELIGLLEQVVQSEFRKELEISNNCLDIINAPIISSELKNKGFSDKNLNFHFGYYNVSGSTFDGSLTASTVHKGVKISCKAGDTFLYAVVGGSAPRNFGFTDENFNILEFGDAGLDNTAEPKIVTAPADGFAFFNTLSWLDNFDNGNVYAIKLQNYLGLGYVNEKTIDTRTSNNFLNSVIKEMFIAGDYDDNINYEIRTFSYDDVTHNKWKITISNTVNGSWQPALVNILVDGSEDYLFWFENNVKIYAVIDWKKVISLNIDINNESNPLNERCYQLEFNPVIAGVINGKRDFFDRKLIGYDNKNAIWSWWNYPQVISKNEKRNAVYFGSVDNYGNRKIFQYDVNDGSYKYNAFSKALAGTKNAGDDHNAITIHILDDGRIATIFAGGHEVDSNLYIKISKKSENIDEWDNAIQIPFPNLVTYAQVLKSDSGEYWIFTRSGAYSWFFIKSSDFINWSEPVEFMRNTLVIPTNKQRSYIRVLPTTSADKFKVVAYGHAEGVDNNIRSGYLDTLNGNLYKDDGTQIQPDASDGYFDMADMTLIVAQTGVSPYTKVRLFDVAVAAHNEVYVSYARYVGTVNAKYYVYYNGTTIETEVSTKGITENGYYGGQSFIGGDKSKIVLSKYLNGNDILETRNYVNGAYDLDTNLLTQNTGSNNEIRAARPICDINGNAVIAHVGYYDFNNSSAGSDVWALHDSDAKLFEI